MRRHPGQGNPGLIGRASWANPAPATCAWCQSCLGILTWFESSPFGPSLGNPETQWSSSLVFLLGYRVSRYILQSERGVTTEKKIQEASILATRRCRFLFYNICKAPLVNPLSTSEGTARMTVGSCSVSVRTRNDYLLRTHSHLPLALWQKGFHAP